MTHILYIEDNEDNIYMLQSRLQRSGFTVSIGTDGTQALELARSHSPELIIMDLRLSANFIDIQVSSNCTSPFL